MTNFLGLWWVLRTDLLGSMACTKLVPDLDPRSIRQVLGGGYPEACARLHARLGDPTMQHPPESTSDSPEFWRRSPAFT